MRKLRPRPQNLRDHSRLIPSHSDSIHKTIKSQRTSWLKCRCLFKREFCSITTSIHHRCFSKPPLRKPPSECLCRPLLGPASERLCRPTFAVPCQNACAEPLCCLHWSAMQMVAGGHCSSMVANSQRPHKL